MALVATPQAQSRDWAQEAVRFAHNLHENPLFTRDALAALISRYPREHYSLVTMGEQNGTRIWREGDFGDFDGTEVLNAIEQGRMWLNLRGVTAVDARYNAVLDQIFATMGKTLPAFEANSRECGILISSPRAQVYYHADLPGQCLWQMAGSKRLYVYPSRPPFITRQMLEDIALFDVEVDIPYRPEYDNDATVLDLEAGQAAHWPLNAPHRVENTGGLSVSMTVSYTTPAIRRAQILHLANGILRHRFALEAKDDESAGSLFWAKAALQKLLRGGRWVQSKRKASRPIDFKLDRQAPGLIGDLRDAA